MKPGRPRFVPTDDQRKHVLISSGIAMPLKRIAAPMGINVKTLKKHFSKELREGFSYVCEMADKSLLKLMAAGNLGAVVWFDKTRRGMREPTSGEHASANAPPPPKLGISFEDGGPGLVRRVPFEIPQDTDGISTVPDAPDKLDTPGEVAPRPAQDFIPKQIEQQVTPASMWERLGMSPEVFAQQPDQLAKAREPLRSVHVHEAKPDSVCPRCRAMWVAS